jgi:hypothetical protein
MKFLNPFPTRCTRFTDYKSNDASFKEFLLKLGYKPNTDCPILYKEEQTLEPYPNIPISKILLDNLD